jgi:hypothetical protein
MCGLPCSASRSAACEFTASMNSVQIDVCGDCYDEVYGAIAGGVLRESAGHLAALLFRRADSVKSC